MSEAQVRRISYLRSIVKDRDAEIERLRAALRGIAEENIGNTAAISVYIARAALGEQHD